MGMTTTYTLQNLKSGANLHPALKGYFLTPESVKPIQALLNNVTGTEICTPFYWPCYTSHSVEETKTRMAQLLIKMDKTLNPHRLLADTTNSVQVLDPRIRNLVKRFLPTLPQNESYSFAEIDAAAGRFAKLVEESGLALFAMTSPCHTSNPKDLTCTWSNFPAQVSSAVWLKSGQEIHPRLTGTYFTQHAAKGLAVLLKRGETPEVQTLLAELVLKMDQAFNPYLILKQHVVIDGSVAALEYFITQNPPPNSNRISIDYAKYLSDRLRLQWAHYFQAADQMICEASPQTAEPFMGAALRINCSYVTTAADVD